MADEEVGVRLRLKERRRFSAEAQAASRDVDRLGDAAARTGRKAGAASRMLGLGPTGLTRALRSVSSAAVPVVGVLSAVGGAVAGMVTKTGFGFNSMREQAEISFTTMLGSGEAATALLDELQRFSALTPFEFPDLVRSAQRMKALGFEAHELIPTLGVVGDTAAGLSLGAEGVDGITTALGQMQLKGKASTEELMQLSERGVDAFAYLRKDLGLTREELDKALRGGAIEGREAVQIVLAGMERDFGGNMARQSRTAAGLWSTVRDLWASGTGLVTKPLFDRASAGLATLAARMDDPRFKAGAERLGETLGRAADHVIGFARRAAGGWRGVVVAIATGDWTTAAGGIDSIVGAGGRLAPILADLFEAGGDVWRIVSEGLVPGFMDLQDTLGGFAPMQLLADALGFVADHAEAIRVLVPYLVTVFGTWRAVTMAVRAAQLLLNFAMTANPIGLVVAAAAGLAVLLVTLWRRSETFRTIVTGVWTAVSDTAAAAVDWIVARWDDAVGFFAALPGRITRAVSGMWDGIRETVGGAIDWIWSKLGDLLGRLEPVIGKIRWVESKAGFLDGLLSVSKKPAGIGDRRDPMDLQKAVTFLVPFMAEGGVVREPGQALVGERGPELLTLPKAARVDPLPNAQGMLTGTADRGPITLQVVLDRRVVAEAVYRDTRERVARR